MTVNARKTISARSGNGAPESVKFGIASAAASETAPRIPVQAMNAVCRHGSLDPESGVARAVKTQTIRATITAIEMSRPSCTSDSADRSPSASTIAGSCRPTRTNRSALTRKTRIAQKAAPERRTSGVVSSGVCQPTYTPAVTTAITPETPTMCAGR